MKSKGENIINIFNTIRLLFRDIRSMIYQFDATFKAQGIDLYWQTNSITNGVSTSLDYPDDWLLSIICRLYKKADRQIYTFTISFERNISEPIFIGAKIDYISDQIGYWDLWNIWHSFEPKEKILNKTYEYKNIDMDDRYRNLSLFAIPLVEIDGNDKIENLVMRILSL